MRKLNIYYHKDIYGRKDATSKFITGLADSASKYFDVCIFCYAEVGEQTSQVSSNYRLYRTPRPRVPLLSKMMNSPIAGRVYEVISVFNPSFYLNSLREADAEILLSVDSYSGFLVCILGRLRHRMFVLRSSDLLLSFGRQLALGGSYFLGMLVVVYSMLIEFPLCKLSSVIMVPSPNVRRMMTMYYGIEGKYCPGYYGYNAGDSSELPNQAEARRNLGLDPTRYTLLFLGSGDWLPNRMAIRYLLTVLAPALSERLPDALVLIVGQSTERYASDIITENVRIMGQVPDLAPFLAAADLGIAPLTIVGGLPGKIVDYLCSGLPALVSVEASKTVEAQAGLYMASMEEFANAIIRLRHVVGAISRDAIKEQALKTYSFESLARDLASNINNRIGERDS